MIDAGIWGKLWNSIANNKFEIDVLKNEINKLPSIEKIKSYLKEINSSKVNSELDIYHFLLQQAGAFGGKAVDINGNRWVNSTFRNYWTPTETSNRKSPVNPMMPMPDTLYERMVSINEIMGGCITAFYCEIDKINWNFDKNSIVYIDPPYKNTSGYNHDFNYELFIKKYSHLTNIYLSEGYKISDNSILLSKGRSKGNINGKINKKPTEEWLNIFK